MAFTTLQGTSASDATNFIGSAGVDSVNLNNVGTTVWLGAQGANDVISFESSTRSVSGYTLRGGQGQDRLSVSDGATSLTGSFINLNSDNDVMQLLSVSSSTIYGGAGSDTLLTGELRSVRFNSNKGDDTTTIAGATGSSIFGGQGNDSTTLNGDFSSSVIQGDHDNDTLTFSNASSLSSTTVNGNEGNDTINVNAITSFSASTLFGGQGDDSINAANSNVGVLASGDAGADALVGGTNNDSLLGGAGDDTLTGNAGADELNAGTGVNTYIYTSTTVAAMQIEGNDTLQNYLGLNEINTQLINFAPGLLNNGTSNRQKVSTVAGQAIGANDVILIANNTANGNSTTSGSTAGALAAFNNAYALGLFANGDEVLFVTSDGTDAYAWLVQKTPGPLAERSFTKVATFEGVTDATSSIFGADGLSISTQAAATANTDIFTIG